MSTFATWAVIIWSAPFVWICILFAAAFVCEVCEQAWDNVCVWWDERRAKRASDKKQKEKK